MQSRPFHLQDLTDIDVYKCIIFFNLTDIQYLADLVKLDSYQAQHLYTQDYFSRCLGMPVSDQEIAMFFYVFPLLDITITASLRAVQHDINLQNIELIKFLQSLMSPTPEAPVLATTPIEKELTSETPSSAVDKIPVASKRTNHRDRLHDSQMFTFSMHRNASTKVLRLAPEEQPQAPQKVPTKPETPNRFKKNMFKFKVDPKKSFLDETVETELNATEKKIRKI